MADVDINPFGEHESRTDDHTETGEGVPFTPVEGGTSTREPECKQETSFRGESQRTKLMLRIYIKIYQKTLVKPQKNFIMIISN